MSWPDVHVTGVINGDSFLISHVIAEHKADFQTIDHII